MVTQKARWLKVRIVAEGKRIWIPSLPLWLIRAGIRIALAVVNRSGEGHEKRTVVISVKEARMILNELASYGKFVLADIEAKDDNTRIYIELK